MANINQHIGLTLKRLRKNYGLSQIQLAEKMNLSFQQIQKYEKGVTAISVLRLQQIADIFGVDITLFFAEDVVVEGVAEPVPFYDSKPQRPKPSEAFNHEEIQLIKSFKKIKNKKIRKGLIIKVKGLADIEKEK